MTTSIYGIPIRFDALRWAVEDSLRLVNHMVKKSGILSVAALMGYSLVPPLWDSVFEPTMVATHELPYVAAHRADRVLRVGQHLVEGALGVKLLGADQGQPRPIVGGLVHRPVPESLVQRAELPAAGVVPATTKVKSKKYKAKTARKGRTVRP